jgi:hypothetical protein
MCNRLGKEAGGGVVAPDMDFHSLRLRMNGGGPGPKAWSHSLGGGDDGEQKHRGTCRATSRCGAGVGAFAESEDGCEEVRPPKLMRRLRRRKSPSPLVARTALSPQSMVMLMALSPKSAST